MAIAETASIDFRHVTRQVVGTEFSSESKDSMM